MNKFWIVICLLVFISCESTDTNTNNKSVEAATENDQDNLAPIRSAVTSKGVDESKLAKITFDEAVYDFGKVIDGEYVKHTYTFKNEGNVPLLITDVKTTCGCTIPSYSEKPIPVGESGEINIQFNSKARVGSVKKGVTVVANTYPNTTKLTLKGKVLPK